LEISVKQLEEARRQGDELLLLDVRNDDEVAVARIEGSVHIPMRDIPERLAELEPWRERRIVVQCHHGGRSARVQQYLLAQGFANVENLAGGIHAWSLEVDPTVPVYQ
jgi:rhodanese-related sulfurtransferase